ncbi:MAG: ubiquinol-cytochrome C chaperone [Pseudomonadota bacterium]|nr:ubiquinol-cytochrome C chaperone [Pseudomonadota bacterium]
MRSLFNRWRTPRNEVEPLYIALVAEARRPAWYVEGGVADTLDGRFAVLASLVALAILRLEDGGESAARGSVALTESFIADMDGQMREEGFGDPSIGKQVRSMVGALASRVDRWRHARGGEVDWADAVRFSIYRDTIPASETAATYSGEALRRFGEGLTGASDETLLKGVLA